MFRHTDCVCSVVTYCECCCGVRIPLAATRRVCERQHLTGREVYYVRKRTRRGLCFFFFGRFVVPHYVCRDAPTVALGINNTSSSATLTNATDDTAIRAPYSERRPTEPRQARLSHTAHAYPGIRPPPAGEIPPNRAQFASKLTHKLANWSETL